MWYRKRKDAEAAYIAQQCGISAELDMVGDILHGDDLEKLRNELLHVSADTVSQLFEVTEIDASAHHNSGI